MIKTALLSVALALVATFALPAPKAHAASATEIDAEVDSTHKRIFAEVGSARDLVTKAEGMLIFPNVIKAGIGIGGEYGEGSLRVRGATLGYYNTVAASIGFQLGAQARSVILMFMTRRALDNCRHSDGWEVGVDGSVALITLGAGGTIDSHNIQSPIIGFVFGSRGLMYNLTLEGSKISRIYR